MSVVIYAANGDHAFRHAAERHAAATQPTAHVHHRHPGFWNRQSTCVRGATAVYIRAQFVEVITAYGNTATILSEEILTDETEAYDAPHSHRRPLRQHASTESGQRDDDERELDQLLAELPADDGHERDGAPAAVDATGPDAPVLTDTDVSDGSDSGRRQRRRNRQHLSVA